MRQITTITQSNRTMSNTNTTTVESITKLMTGDTVTVTGNGMDVTGEVTDISLNEWKDRMTATVETDTHTWTLTDTDHPLQSDGITSNNGAVTVELHN